MPERPRRHADQGLFLKHFNAGREMYDAGQVADAERELEEAYLLRPRDHKVLNLLGLVYFKQEKLEKAEEVYRKLAAESPEAHTLFYNLGLIYLKLARLEDAETAFSKALELNRSNPKIHFYLGSIYEKQRRFQDAIFQYRQAGANIMVRRVENKLTPPPRPVKAAGDDTAEFRASDVMAQLDKTQPAARTETEPFMLPSKKVGPVSDVLLADGAPGRAQPPPRSGPVAAKSADETRPPLASPETLPPAGGAARGASPDIVAFLAGLPPASASDRERTASAGLPSAAAVRRASGEGTGPHAAVRSGGPFRLIERNLLEASFAGKLFVKQGTIYSYSGNLTFWVKDKRPGAKSALVIITGTGKVLLTDREREISLVDVSAEPLHVQPTLLLACEETLTPRYDRVGEGDDAPEFVALEGRGAVALSVGSRPLMLSVSPEMPVSVAAKSLIMWTGELEPTRVLDPQLTEVLAAPTGEASLIRLSGRGRVLVEQV
jgi:uncharacterized protein (AIM24 family)